MSNDFFIGALLGSTVIFIAVIIMFLISPTTFKTNKELVPEITITITNGISDTLYTYTAYIGQIKTKEL